MADNKGKNNEAIRRLMEDILSVQPQQVQGQGTVQTELYRELLFRKLMTIFRIDGAPEGFDTEWFFRYIYNYGYCVVADTKEFGVVPVEGALSGFSFYGYPTEFETSNPLITPPEKMVMGEGAVLIYLSNISLPNGGWLFKGARQLVDTYAEKLASIDAGIDVNLMNSKVAYVFGAENENQANTVKTMYAEITAGRPAVFVRSRVKENLKSDGGVMPFFNNVKQSYIVDMLQDAKRVVMNEFLTWIGIDNAPVDKKERVQNAETNSNNYEIYNAIDDWERNLKKGFDQCNKLFGTGFKVVRTCEERQREQEEERKEDLTNAQTADTK